MQHHFDIDLAEKYGILEAVLLNHFQFWTAKNEANGNNLHEGLYWTFNSVKAMKKLFPYASEGQIRRALKKLQGEGLIVTGNFNKSTYDRTTWYALTENGKCILQNRQMEVSESKNGNCENDKPIPDNISDNRTDKKDIYRKIVESYNEICTSMPKCLKLTEDRKRKIKKRLAENSYDDIIMAFRKAEESEFLSGRNGDWQGCSIDWFIKNPDNIIKVLEGKYDSKKAINKTDLELKKAYEAIRGDKDEYRPFNS